MVWNFPGALNVAKFIVNDLECNPPVKSALHLKDHAENPLCVCSTRIHVTHVYLQIYFKPLHEAPTNTHREITMEHRDRGKPTFQQEQEQPLSLKHPGLALS